MLDTILQLSPVNILTIHMAATVQVIFNVGHSYIYNISGLIFQVYSRHYGLNTANTIILGKTLALESKILYNNAAHCYTINYTVKLVQKCFLTFSHYQHQYNVQTTGLKCIVFQAKYVVKKQLFDWFMYMYSMISATDTFIFMHKQKAVQECQPSLNEITKSSTFN